MFVKDRLRATGVFADTEKIFTTFLQKNVPLECNECGFRAPSMVGMRRHCQTEHGNNAIKECVYCCMAFISEEKFRELYSKLIPLLFYSSLSHVYWKAAGWTKDIMAGKETPGAVWHRQQERTSASWRMQNAYAYE